MDQYACPDRTTPLQSACTVNDTEYYDGWVWAIFLFMYVIILGANKQFNYVIVNNYTMEFCQWKML